MKISILAIVMLLSCTMAQAQENPNQRKTRTELAQMQAKHIAKELALDKQATDQYVDTYCRHQQEVWAMGPRVGKRTKAGMEPKSESETEQEIKDRFEHSQKLLILRQKYYAEYCKFLTQNQIKRAYELEKQMMIRLSKNRQKTNRK